VFALKLYRFLPADQKREATNFENNYQVQLPEQLDAREYGFVWVKNMELKEFTVFAFGINWKASD
jgi:hypothetical protein